MPRKSAGELLNKSQVVSKGQAQRAKIVKTAITFIARHGLEGTSFQMIADACGVSQSAVLYHFKSKAELIEGALMHILNNNYSIIENALLPTDDGLTRIRKYFKTQLLWRNKHTEEAQIVILLYYYAGFEKRFTDLYESILKSARSRLEGYLHAAQRERLIAKSIDVGLIAETLHDAVLGGIVNYVVEDTSAKNDAKIFRKWDALLSDLLDL